MNSNPRAKVGNRNCCVFGCHSRAGKNLGVSFHAFPKEGEIKVNVVNDYGVKELVDKRLIWMRQIRTKKDVSDHMTVCSLHFKWDDYILPNVECKKRRLKRYAIPTLHLPKQDSFGKKPRPIYKSKDLEPARGRLRGALQELVEQSEDESASSEEDTKKYRYRTPRKKDRAKRRRSDSSPVAAAYHHTYVMKLFDRSVDLARFEEDTPLYPICRAWMANQPRNPQAIIKRRASTPDNEFDTSGDRFLREVHSLPRPIASSFGRVPSPLPEQRDQNKDDINLNYDEQPPVSKDELIRNHLQRWSRVKQKWVAQANKNEERFDPSLQILTAIYNKAQENME